MDTKYKAKVAFVTPRKVTEERKFGEQPVGTFYIDVAFRVYSQSMPDGKWQAVNVAPGDDIINKMYILNPIASQGKRSTLEINREALKNELGWNLEGNGQNLVGKEVELIVYEVNGFTRVRYVNNPDAPKKGALPVEDMSAITKLLLG